MNYLLAEGLSKSYGDKILFQDVDLSINKGQKVALIAKNGTGKSTLLKILVGKEGTDKGWVRVHKDITLGYLDQEPDLDENLTILEAVFNSDNPVLKTIEQYEWLIEQQEINPSLEKEQQLTAIMEKMQTLDAWDYEVKVKQILSKFKVNALNRKVGLLSGGERKRVAMASVLIRKPDLLILDEPTNHIDLEMVEWLEEYLSKQNMSLLLVTHDRYFLNRVTNEIIELENGITLSYKGNYEYFLEQKALRKMQLKVEVDKAQKLMKKELDWIRAQPKARTTKSKSRIDAFDKIQERAYQKVKEDEVHFSQIKMPRIGGKTLELWHIDKKYEQQQILKDFTYTFKRRERVGIVGPNGSGKTTLLRMIMNEAKPDNGKIVVGKTIVFGYYTQDGISLLKDKQLIDVVRDIAEILPLEKGKYLSAAQLLAHFQFPYSMHTQYVSTLSGGEKRRLYLLTVLMQNPNFLILDEPTNDLDLLTLNLLEDFLLQFKGCLVIVSHDRYFMDKLVNHLFVFEGEGRIKDFPGNYTQYREAKLEAERIERAEKKAQAAKEPKQQRVKNKPKEKVKLSYNEQREFKQLEKDIEALETEKANLEEQLNTPNAPHEELMQWSQRIGEIMELLDEKEMRWLELSEFV